MTAPTPAQDTVERVARALFGEIPGDIDTRNAYNRCRDKRFFRHQATAAIAAMQPAIDAAVLAERERCAMLVEQWPTDLRGTGIRIVDAIRKEPT